MLIFLKLGGSLITDKATPETARHDVIRRIALEIRQALDARPDLSLVIGHGSGSFGHIPAQHYGTHRGVSTPEQWRGFAHVGMVAARLTSLVLDTLHEAGIPALRIPPSASARCENGKLVEMALGPLRRALETGLIPLVHGDVGFDTVKGGTIISTEDVFGYLGEALKPDRMLLVGDYEGVFDSDGKVISQISRATLAALGSALRGSSHADVTGGMATKVTSMVELCERVPGLTVRIFSGDAPGMIQRSLIDHAYAPGTLITA